VFVKAIRAKYPEIGIIGSSGPYKDGPDFEYLWKEMRALGVDLVDEHYYANEQFFTENAARYDSYPRTGPKVFAGEYACHGVDGRKWNHFNASLLEAAFMTGLERNADIVHMASYAPLLAHVEGWQWRPDMIWFDNLRSFRSCSWYVQKLYSQYKGTHALVLTDMEGVNITGAEGQNGLFASSVYDADKNQVYVKIINTSDQAQPVKINFDGLKKKEVLKGVEAVSYHSDDLDADNTLDEPEKIVPQVSSLEFEGKALEVTVAPETFMVYILQK
jgi:alpha-L-arabinofuranosidase